MTQGLQAHADRPWQPLRTGVGWFTLLLLRERHQPSARTSARSPATEMACSTLSMADVASAMDSGLPNWYSRLQASLNRPGKSPKLHVLPCQQRGESTPLLHRLSSAWLLGFCAWLSDARRLLSSKCAALVEQVLHLI